MLAANGHVQVHPTALQRIALDAMEAFSLLHSRDMKASAEQFYGFSPGEVTDIHLNKCGSGSGIWFRLRDGRVFDLRGIPSETGREWYGATMH